MRFYVFSCLAAITVLTGSNSDAFSVRSKDMALARQHDHSLDLRFPASRSTNQSHYLILRTEMSSRLEASTVTSYEYDIVKVDLSDGRDYPIYIGDSFGDEEAGRLLRSHVKGNRALLITNDRIAPMYLEKYASLLKEDEKIRVGTLQYMILVFKPMYGFIFKE